MAFAKHNAASLRKILLELDNVWSSISTLINEMETRAILELSINYKGEVHRALLRLGDFTADGQRQLKKWLIEHGHFEGGATAE